jgi:hypothetical protein
MGPQDGKGIINVMIGNMSGDRNIACYILQSEEGCQAAERLSTNSGTDATPYCGLTEIFLIPEIRLREYMMCGTESERYLMPSSKL